jgi:hypothetical protein
MLPANADFAFTITFERGLGDPRRVFEAASALIAGFEELDEAVADSVDAKLNTAMVLEDVEAGSIKVWLRTIVESIGDEGLKDGEFKKAIGPALVRAKYAVLKFLDDEKGEAPQRIDELRDNLRSIAADTDVRHLPDYAPIHQGKLIGSLEKIQDAKRTLGPKDKLSIEAEGKVYEVDLTKTWSPATTVPVTPVTETNSEMEMFLTIRKPDLLGGTMWQFRHGKFSINAPILDEKWLQNLHDKKIALHSGDALRCKVRFTYVYDDAGDLVDQKTEILRVLGTTGSGKGEQLAFF